ncbi:protein kinase [Spirillospora sp. NPDC029432]|uniref:protein kinase domain-containing protein n=1 Tax=Spirillospora sp. NPDC029432 TaxID=3154599 RepID=UPI0034522373
MPGPSYQERLPARIGPYTVEDRLGEGGMGTVYLGADDSGRKVAIKVIRSEHAADPMYRARFEAEVAAAQRVRPFCTAPVLDADPHADPPYLVTEFVSGSSLKDAAPLHGADLEALAVGMASALTAIHDAGVVHRDLKPANVLLSPYGPRVIDFGIARGVESTRLTMTGGLVGTPAFMSPEQLNGKDVTAASDVFSWGATLAFAASGAPCFGGDTLPAIIHQIISGEPNLNGLDGTLRSVVEAALAKDAADRPTAQRLLERLVSSAGSQRDGNGQGNGHGNGNGAGPSTQPGRHRATDPGTGPGAGPGTSSFQAGAPLPPPALGSDESAALVERQYRLAAEAGDMAAMYNLGVLLNWRGQTAEAEYWYRRANGAQTYGGQGHAQQPPYGRQPYGGQTHAPQGYAQQAYNQPSYSQHSQHAQPVQRPHGAAYQPAHARPAGGYNQQPAADPYKPVRTNSSAVYALTFGIVGLVTCGLPSIPAIIAGHISWGQMKRNGEKGMGLAATGIALGYVMVALWLLILIGVLADDGSSN